MERIRNRENHRLLEELRENPDEALVESTGRVTVWRFSSEDLR